MTIDYRAYPVLFVDDEDHNLVTYRYAFGPDFSVFTALTGEEALAILRDREIAVLVTDQKMPDMDGVELCERARSLRPETVRIVVTAYASVPATTGAINRGGVSRYLEKPWQPESLAEVLRTAIDGVHVQRVVREMELRILRGDEEQYTLRRKYRDVIHGLSVPFRAVREGLESVAASLGAARRALGWAQDGVAHEALSHVVEASQHLEDITPAMQQIAAIEATERGVRTDHVTPACANTCDLARAVEASIRISERGLNAHGEIRVALEDGVMVPLRASAIGEIVSNLPIFADFDPEKLVKTAEGCGEILSADGGLDHVLLLIRSNLSKKLRETAYAVALEIAAADLEIKPEETRFLEMLRDSLELDQLIVSGLERGIRARNMVL